MKNHFFTDIHVLQSMMAVFFAGKFKTQRFRDKFMIDLSSRLIFLHDMVDCLLRRQEKLRQENL